MLIYWSDCTKFLFKPVNELSGVIFKGLRLRLNCVVGYLADDIKPMHSQSDSALSSDIGPIVPDYKSEPFNASDLIRGPVTPRSLLKHILKHSLR